MNSQSIATLDTLNGFPISAEVPENGEVLAFSNNQWVPVTISDTDITGMLNVGTASHVFKQIVGGVAELRTIGGSNNIDSTQNTDTVNLSLKSDLTGINKITLSGGAYLEMNSSDYYCDLMLPLNLDRQLRIGVQRSFGKFSIFTMDKNGDWYFALNNAATINSLLCRDQDGKLANTFPYNLVSVGTGVSIVKNRVQNTFNLYSWKSDANINIIPGTDDYTLQLNTIIDVQRINSSNLRIDGLIYLPNILSGTATSILGINASNEIITTTAGLPYTASNIGSGAIVYKQQTGNDFEFKTVLTDGNLSVTAQPNTLTIGMNAAISPTSLNATNLQINSIIQATNISVDTPVYTMGLLNTGQIIKYIPSVSPSTNIYNSDGQLTSVDRIVNGLTPGSVNNRLILNGCNISFQNNISYDYSNVNISGRDDRILSFDSVSSRGIISPYNKNSQKGQLTITGSFGYTIDFYRSDLINLGSQNWTFDVEIFENNTNAALDSFAGKWTFEVNNSYLATIPLNSRVLIKMGSSSGNNPSTAFFKNLINLSIYRPASSFGAIVLSFENVTSVGSNQFFKWTVKDYSLNDKTVTILNNTSLITPTQSYYKPSYQPSYYFSGVGAPPSLAFEYMCFGKDICIDVRSNWISINNLRSANINVLLNGSIVMTIPVRCGAGQKDGYYIFSQRRVLNYQTLLNSSVLLLGLNNITHTITGTNPADFSFTGCPYSVDVSFV